MGRDGVPRPDNQAVYKPDATTCPWRYPGQYEDSETGLYYNRFRYYDPEQGRYLSQDPIGLEGGLPLYGYVHDPSGWVDPFGLSCKTSDPGLDDFVERLKKAGVKVLSVNVEMIGEGKRVLGEVDVVTEKALIQFKSGPSSASKIIDQVKNKTEPFVTKPVIAFIDDTGKAGDRTVKYAKKKIAITNDFDELVAMLL